MEYETISEELQAIAQPLFYLYAAYFRSAGNEQGLSWLQARFGVSEETDDVQALWDRYAQLQQTAQEPRMQGVVSPLREVLETLALSAFSCFVVTLALVTETMPEHADVIQALGQPGVTLSLALTLYSASWQERLLCQREWLRQEAQLGLLLDIDAQTGVVSLHPMVLRYLLALPISCTHAQVYLPSDALEPPLLELGVQDALRRQLARRPAGNLFLLSGEAGSGRRYQVRQYASSTGTAVVFVGADAMETDGAWLANFRRLVTLLRADVCVCGLGEDAAQNKAVYALIETLQTPQVFVTASSPLAWKQEGYVVTQLALPLPSLPQRAALWQQLLPSLSADICDRLAARYAFTIGRTLEAAQQTPGCTEEMLCQACNQQLPRVLSSLAVPVRQGYTWEDLVLPDRQIQLLRHIVTQVQYRAQVMEHWGMGAKLAYGGGVRAIFSGAPGTGKTMAAQVLAAQLHMELYKVNLSSVVSKYIGDTEKNLETLFAEAAQSGGILFFDEADALFGKRGEQKDSHDKYANMQTAFLLQKFEEFEGVAILATNYLSNLDAAFTRRIQNRVEFPKPDAEHRKRIWRAMLLPSAPFSQALDTDFLAQTFELTGAEIKNAVMQAAFLAAAQGSEIGMAELVWALQLEFAKMDKVVSRASWGRYAYLAQDA